jgi:hypothetical protein
MVDAQRICSWLSVSFGVVDESYHQAYSCEMIRQARRAAFGLAAFDGVIIDNKKDEVLVLS